MLGEAVIVRGRAADAGDTLAFLRKQTLQLASKMRYVSAQFDAYLTGELWRATASHAIACVAVSLTTAVVLIVLERRIPGAERLLIGALCAGGAGFVAGWGGAVFSRGERDPNPARRDIFVDAPLDPSG